MTRKIILTDIDGVVLNWEEGFHEFMQERGHELIKDYQEHYNMSMRFGGLRNVGNLINQFNHSVHIGFLEVFRDAAEVIPALHAQGYEFIAITSLSNHPHSRLARIHNLNTEIGLDIFKDVICLDIDAPKLDILQEQVKQYPDAEMYWLEDKWENYRAGERAGITSFLMDHKHNAAADTKQRIDNWADFAQRIGAQI